MMWTVLKLSTSQDQRVRALLVVTWRASFDKKVIEQALLREEILSLFTSDEGERDLKQLLFPHNFRSPHLINVEERIRVNGRPLDRRVFAEYFWLLYDKFNVNAV